MSTSTLSNHKVVSREDWLQARKELLAKEKEYTRAGDELAKQRQQLPWEKVEKNYQFDGPAGKQSLSDLFAGRSQLFVYHFMFGPNWVEGCPSCSYLMDHIGGMLPHLKARDVAFAAVSRAPYSQFEPFKKRMQWIFPWVSSANNSFNFDYQVSFTPEQLSSGNLTYNYQSIPGSPAEELPGISVFYKDKNGDIFHTYSTFARGTESLVTTYRLLDLVPKGRDEEGLTHTMAWVRHHDKYDANYVVDAKANYVPPKGSCCGGGCKS
ncbi:MAG: thioredoxin family protein [Gemmatales bacterium]